MELTPDNEVILTGRNLEQTAKVFGMTRTGLIDWLSSKRSVLNIGSGGGVLEKEFELFRQQANDNINTEIYSLDIAYRRESGLEFARSLSHLLITQKDISLKRVKEKLQNINSVFESRIIPDDFNMINFPNDSFDGVISSYAFAHINDPKKLEKPYKEIYRILKPGAQALISVSRNIIPINLDFTISEIKNSGKHSFITFTKKPSLESLPKS